MSLLLLLGCAAGPVPSPPDLILLSVETVRADQLALYGAPVDTMPHLGGLAAEGRWFRQAWSPAPWTLPSMTSLLTGLPPAAHGVVDGGRALPQAAQTLAEQLADAGYETAFFGVNTLFTAGRGLDQGFATWQAWGSRNGREVIDEVERFLAARDPGRPLFLVVHLFEPHCPYEPPRPLQERWWPPPDPTDVELTPEQFAQLGGCFSLLDPGEVPVLDLDRYRAAYRAELTQADELLARLLPSVQARPAVVAVVGDHGEGFWEHGDFGHGRTLYQESLAVPLVLSAPGLSPGPVETPVSTQELADTFRRAAGLPLGAWGRDLLGTLSPAPVFAETDDSGHHLAAVRVGEQKLVVDRVGGGAQRWDLSADPGERAPGPADPALQATLEAHRRRAAATLHQLGIDERELAPEVLDQLRLLGYRP